MPRIDGPYLETVGFFFRMSSLQNRQFAQSWSELLSRFSTSHVQQVDALATQWQIALADHFYARLLGDESAAQLISHDQVRTRLHASLCRWIVGVFGARAGDDMSELVSLQRQVGTVHARLGVPVHLVLRAAHSLKDKFAQLLGDESGLSRPEQLDLLLVFHGVMDMTMEIMSHAYATSHDRNSRAQEAYRLFAVVQNVATERQRQRAALLDWENRMMFELAIGSSAAQLPRIGASEFGLWFRHKGAHAFQGTEEVHLIQASMERIDQVLLPALAREGADGPADRMSQLRDLRDETQAIAFRLDVLFRQTNELEAGRDALTRLLNRKYLPVVMNKEVAHARQHGSPFAVLAIDVDNFKQINDGHGHDAGDLVLQQLAVVLSNNCRAGDYIFRLGGEEFFMLLVDIRQEDALKAAESVRAAVEEEGFRVSSGDRSLRVTVSIGLAMYDGHPDYQLLMRRADDALYQAKRQGRNRVVLASGAAATT